MAEVAATAAVLARRYLRIALPILMVVLTVPAIFLLGGFDNPWTWVIGILYFTFVHSSLILLGVMGLSRAINGRSWRFPVFGPREPS